MSITLNGNDHTLDSKSTVSDLLSSIGLGDKPVIVEHNHNAILPQNFAKTEIKDGDKIEIVALAAGG
ncbi:sulfur carrier protein ThiS [Luteolibacter sp. AS25]|uniref:sulfur carrier protein ThiS n=1 Tax=Luteolibacter sp. AS25 TaxID=3135776 RepID=UPI00398B6592